MPAKRLLKDQDRKFSLLFQGHPQPMWIFGADSRRFLDVNQSAADLYGYSIDEFRSMSLNDVQPEEDVQRFLEQLQDASKARGCSWRHRTKSGRAIDVELAVH